MHCNNKIKIQVNFLIFKSKIIKTCNFRLKRQDEVNNSRLRLEHSKQIQLYLLNGDEQPGCIFCDCQLTFWSVRYVFCSRRVQKSQDKLMCIQSYRFCNNVILTKKFKLFNILDVYNLFAKLSYKLCMHVRLDVK